MEVEERAIHSQSKEGEKVKESNKETWKGQGTFAVVTHALGHLLVLVFQQDFSLFFHFFLTKYLKK